jgi:Holliday junction resolvasome RuvABC DNA-binding subunit
MMKTIATFEEQIEQINKRVDKLTQEHEDVLNRLEAIPGIEKKSARQLSVRLALHWKNLHVLLPLSVGRLCPGNNERRENVKAVEALSEIIR